MNPQKSHTADPVIGPTEGKVPTTMSIKHADLPGLNDAHLGTRVKFMVTGKVTSNRAADKYGDGEATIEVLSIEDENTDKKENASTMHISKLRDKISKPEQHDETDTPDEDRE